MTGYQDEIVGLVKDARLVSAYAARVGQLPDGDLISSAGKIESSLATTGPSADDYATFLKQLSAAIRSISPVTLIDLGSTWIPYPGSTDYKWFNRLLVVLSVLLIMLIAFYTQIYTTARDTLATIHTVQQVEVEDKLDRLRILLTEHPALLQDKTGTNPATTMGNTTPTEHDLAVARSLLSTYLKELREVNEAASEMQIGIFYITQDNALYPPIIFQLYQEVNGVLGALSRSVTPSSLASNPPLTTDTLKSQAAFLNSKDNLASTKTTIEKQATDDPDIRSNPAYIYGLTALYNLQYLTAVESTWIETCKRVVFVLGSWVLPAAYGLIGSIVFQMRRILSPLQPSMPPIRLVFRMALGAFAGIIVTWFWAPTAQSIAVGNSLSITAFGIAFLLGYSSEIFFVLLDTLVTRVLSTITQQPVASK